MRSSAMTPSSSLSARSVRYSKRQNRDRSPTPSRAAIEADPSPSVAAASSPPSPCSASSPPSSSHSFKRSRPSFTDRASNDIITLPLVLSFLDVYSMLKARRACQTWRAATLRPTAWRDVVFAVNLEHITTIPPTSFRLVQHLCLVRNLKAPPVDMKATFAVLGAMASLKTLRLEECTVDAELCELISERLPRLKELDLKMCSEFEDAGMRAKLARCDALLHARTHHLPRPARNDEENRILAETAEDARLMAAVASATGGIVEYPREPRSASVDCSYMREDDEDDNGLYGAARYSTSPSVRDAMTYFSLPPPPSANLPALRLPLLQSLKLPFTCSVGHTLALLAPLSSLRTLQLRRVASNARSLDTIRGERHFCTLLNRLFAHLYSDSLQHLLLSNLHHHEYDRLHFDLLNVLTHLSLTQNNNYVAINQSVLKKIAALPLLEECEIRVGNGAVAACQDIEWWNALGSITALSSLSIWCQRGSRHCTAEAAATIKHGLTIVLKNRLSKLTQLSLSNGDHLDDGVIALLRYSPTIHTVSVNGAVLSLASLYSLATLPRLTSLELIACRGLLGDAGLCGIIDLLPRLASLTLRLPSSSQMAGDSVAVLDRTWMRLASMPALTTLHLSGFALFAPGVVESWCRQAEEGAKERRRLDQNSSRTFAGFDQMPDDPASTAATSVEEKIDDAANSMTATSPSSSTMSLQTAAAAPSSSSSISPSSSSSSLLAPPSPGVALRSFRCSGWMISHDQCLRLLRSLPQLQLLSVHLLEASAGAFAPPAVLSPRLIAGGGDFLQTLIAVYITHTHPLK